MYKNELKQLKTEAFRLAKKLEELKDDFVFYDKISSKKLINLLDYRINVKFDVEDADDEIHACNKILENFVEYYSNLGNDFITKEDSYKAIVEGFTKRYFKKSRDNDFVISDRERLRYKECLEVAKDNVYYGISKTDSILDFYLYKDEDKLEKYKLSLVENPATYIYQLQGLLNIFSPNDYANIVWSIVYELASTTKFSEDKDKNYKMFSDWVKLERSKYTLKRIKEVSNERYIYPDQYKIFIKDIFNDKEL